MSQYTEEEIDKIIDDCENLIVPDDEGSVDEVLPRIVSVKKIKNPKSVILTRYLNERQTVDSDEYFENFFQESKEKKHSKQVICCYSSFGKFGFIK